MDAARAQTGQSQGPAQIRIVARFLNPNMKYPTRTFTVLLAATASVFAQSVPVPASATKTDSETVQLSPFEVRSGADRGYAASTAMSGTRTNEKLENLPNAISVMTADLLADLGALNFFDAADYGVSSENLFNDTGTRGAAIGARSGNQISFRGLPSVRQLRDGFAWYMPQDIFNTERIEFSRGPGGLSYGDVDAGGTVNVSTKRASLTRKGTTVAVRWEDYGGRRVSLDHELVLVPKRLGLRLNGVYNDGEGVRQRSGTDIKGIAAALRWQLAPRTALDVTFEGATQRDGQTHVVLTDQTRAYVRGTGTNALDANPAIAGVQADGVGQFRIQAAGDTQAWTLIDNKFYNLESTSVAVFRSSRNQEGTAVGNLLTNPLLIPRLGASEAIVPRYQDWGGPDNYVDQRWYAATVELRHDFTPNLRGLVSANAQRDTVTRPKTLHDGLQDTFGGRSLFIDVNPSLPDPTDPAGLRLVPNPRFEQYYIDHQLALINDQHEIKNVRGVLVYDAQLPFGITQRLVGSAGVRYEKYKKDVFNENFTAEETARRGLTGNAARAFGNRVYRSHYLSDGNSDAALRNPPIPGVTTFTRQNSLGNNARFDQNLANIALNALGSYFNGRLHTTLGVSRDRWHQKTANTAANPADANQIAFLDANNRPIPEGGTIPTFEFTEQWVTNKSFGGVFRVFNWLSLTGAWLESTQFTDNFGRDLNNRPIPGLTGEGIDGGARLSFLDGRITLSYVRFKTIGGNVTSAISAASQTELNLLLPTPLSNTIDFRDRKSLGHELEAFFSPTPNLTARISYSESTLAFTNFYPLLVEKIAIARAAATARGLDPIAATATSQQFLDDAPNAVATGRRNANFTGRYSFTRGRLKGLAIGGSGRYAEGRYMAAVNIGGFEVLPRAKTEDEYILNGFASYRRKFGRVNWTGQINVNNVLDEVSNQGSAYRFARYTEPRRITLTNTFAF